MGDEAVRVAVRYMSRQSPKRAPKIAHEADAMGRVRPFNSREKAAGSKLIIKMTDSKSTTIIDPSDQSEKVFAFDHRQGSMT